MSVCDRLHGLEMRGSLDIDELCWFLSYPLDDWSETLVVDGSMHLVSND